MRITNPIRQAFVSSALNDVPQIDYDEKIRSLVNKKTTVYLEKAGIESIDSARLNTNYVYVGNQSFFVRGVTTNEAYFISTDKEIQGLSESNKLQRASLQQLKTLLESSIAVCTTRKQVITALPEFEKYLPAADPVKTTNLPAMANVLSTFVKAGWPKNQKRISI